ncbi:MAG: hypothetical protein ACI88A_005176 [Paraglaciecola sp.]|jgi:hypothetical protein
MILIATLLDLGRRKPTWLSAHVGYPPSDRSRLHLTVSSSDAPKCPLPECEW